MNSDLRPYRLPFLQRLVETYPWLGLTLYVGQARKGLGAPATPLPEVPVPVNEVRNWFWPFGQHRVFWQSGALSILWSPAEVIVCPEVVHNLSVWLIRLLHRRFGKRFILTGFMVRSPSGALQHRVRRLLLRWLRASADAVIAYTEGGRRELEADAWPAGRIYVSQNTIDTEQIERLSRAVPPKELDDLRSQLGLGSSRVALFIGKLIPEKQVDRVIRAIAQLDHPLALVIVGDGPERKRLRQVARGGNVRFVGAVYDEVKLARLLALADFLVLPGRVGLTCVLGFAASLPCVTTSPNAVAQTPEFEYVEAGRNALVTETSEVEEYASALRRLLTEPELLDHLKAGAVETARALRIDNMVEAFADAIRSVSGTRQGL